MISVVYCPTCQHALKVEDAQLGRRFTCPSCNSPFLAAAPAGAKAGPEAAAPLNKTMLGEIEPPIQYSCPRCKKPLEDPASEAGTKKPCPHCGQRVQVPAASTAGAAPNKTMLGQVEPDVPQGKLVSPEPEPAPRQERCLECGRNMTGWENVFTCQDCGSGFCSSSCVREHRYHAHEPRRRGRPAPRPDREPEPDHTGLVLGLVFGGLFFFILIVVLLVLVRW